MMSIIIFNLKVKVFLDTVFSIKSMTILSFSSSMCSQYASNTWLVASFECVAGIVSLETEETQNLSR